MSIVTQLGQRAEAVETRFAAEEFIKLGRLLLAAKGDKAAALDMAQSHRVKPRVVEILKSVISPVGLGDWAGIGDYQNISAAFSESLRQLSVYDAMLPDFVPAPLRSRGIVVTTGIVGGVVGERQFKPISTLSLANALVEPRKASAIIVVNDEVVKATDAATSALFGNELRKAVVAATDSVFIAELIAGTTPIASAGNTYANVLADFRALFSALTVHGASKLYFVISPANLKSAMFITSNQGAPVLSVLQATGKSLPVTVIASDQIAANAALLIDASQIAGSSDVIVLDSSSTTSLQMETTPDSPPTAATTAVSLFQTNRTALRAERHFAFTLLRTSAVASLSGVSY